MIPSWVNFQNFLLFWKQGVFSVSPTAQNQHIDCVKTRQMATSEWPTTGWRGEKTSLWARRRFSPVFNDLKQRRGAACRVSQASRRRKEAQLHRLRQGQTSSWEVKVCLSDVEQQRNSHSVWLPSDLWRHPSTALFFLFHLSVILSFDFKRHRNILTVMRGVGRVLESIPVDQKASQWDKQRTTTSHMDNSEKFRAASQLTLLANTVSC